MLANFNTPPKTCADFPSGSAAEDMKRHIEINFDNLLFDESFTVSRHVFSSNNCCGANYHSTFRGLSFSDKTEERCLVSNIKPWCDTSCSDSFKISWLISTKIDTKVETMMDYFSLAVGIPFYAQIAAMNSVSLGTCINTKTVAEKPRSSP